MAGESKTMCEHNYIPKNNNKKWSPENKSYLLQCIVPPRLEKNIARYLMDQGGPFLPSPTILPFTFAG